MLTTVRTIVVLASINILNLHQLDVNNAFLHGELQEDEYITIPLGVKHAKPNQVCRIVKSLYGLNQSIIKWHERLIGFLIKHQYKQAIGNVSLFTKQNQTSFTIMLVYVDDIIVSGNSLQEMKHIKETLHK